MRWITLLLVLLGAGGFQGCSDNSNGSGQTQEAPDLPRGDGNLYVANNGTGSLLAFDNASTAEGDLSPDRHFPETIAEPTGLFLDQTTDTLYVANTGQNAILIYENASTLELPDGLASADRVISGPQTGLRLPGGVAYDATRQRLYVANEGNASILIFHAGCSETGLLDGDIPPCQVLSGASTLLDAPGELAVDPARDILYISNEGTNSILVYENASQSSTQGNLPPTRTISSIQSPLGIFIDSTNDRLYVVQSEDQAAVLVYENASTRAGQTSPDRTLAGSNTLLVFPIGIDVDIDQNLIYVVNNDHTADGDSALLIFSDPFANCAVCDVSPSRIITGDQTGLTDATDIAVDSQLDRIYVSNTLDNSILLFGMEGNIAPIKIVAGANTGLGQPNSFFYDSSLDRLYVANSSSTAFSTSAITVYHNVSTAALSSTPPSWTISGGGLTTPTSLFIHDDLLLVLDTNQLRIYDLANFNPPFGTNTTFPPPKATYTSNSGLSQPSGMTVDQIKNEVYILSGGNRSIRVYDLSNPITDAPPKRIINFPSTMTGPRGLSIDNQRDILYVTDTSSHTLFAFNGASKSVPDQIRILSSSTNLAAGDRLSTPLAPGLNIEKDRLFMINRGTNAIFIFDKVSTLPSGEIEPDRKIEGSDTALAFPNQNLDVGLGSTGALWIDTSRSGERLFIGQPRDPTCTLPTNQCPRGSLLLFSAEGDIPPGQAWSGGEHKLVGPSAVAVDPRRDLVYVANQGDPTITSDDSLFLFTHASRSDGKMPFNGTFSVTEGSVIVTGTGTSFTTDLAPGDHIKIEENALIVSTIHSDTTLTLTSPYPGETASGLLALRLPWTPCSPIYNPEASSCPDTKLNNPAGLFVDSDQDRLYVSNAGTDCADPAAPCNSLLVFHAASNFSFNAVPNQVITSDRLNSPRGLTVDLGRQTLFVANHGNNSVLVFKNVGDLNGEVSPDAEIGGAATGIDEPIGVAIDPERDILYVLNEGTSEILVFENASSLDGDSAPARTLSGNFIQTPSFLFLDAEGDLLYVADREADAVHIFTDASRADGEAAHKTITGVNTGLNQPVGLAVDTAR
ncbi:MAG: beta-propeller fold lactonase family protein [Candidatus Manganitrophus sp.]|nr:beta-propeller fold lactonase family protein [Candidatus Manganitrophus sp.]MDC4223155.1 beta-propeller fold lactonase family protein [Candidatus Manganitrophus sp.]WDT69448.1 MAG: beta-propeller fold lactonase family protein [Candidatus Manganitrophus sp.]WDT78961.1 MAG: beta-propeller fold lactonase family protein [Candidatus Manganitrophus sp.]